MKALEVLNLTNDGAQWLRPAEEKEGVKLVKKGDTVTVDWVAPDGAKVKTVYNLSQFAAYSIIG